MKKQALYALIPVLGLGAVGIFTANRWQADYPNNAPIQPSLPATSTFQAAEPKPQAAQHHALSMPALFTKEYNGSELKLVRVLEKNSIYTRHYITYKSGEFTISGIMNIPVGDGPFPVLILNHGHIDTSIYTNGRGLRREQDYLARNGYAVLHPDYRNHAQSSKDTRDELLVRVGYVEDVINAVYAVKNSGLPTLDTRKIGMLGHSMGGGITLSTITAQPDLVGAAVLYAPVSGDYARSYERWMSRRPETAREIAELYGTPTSSPAFWKNLSAETYYSRIKTPVAIFHGTADADVPLSWSEDTRDLLQTAGKSVTLTVYQNGPHEFAVHWPDFMEQTKKFFDAHLKK